MELIRVNSSEYKNYFDNPFHVYNSVDFSELNKEKVDDIYYLIFKDKKIRLGIILGLKDNFLLSPFSSPFGSFTFLRENISFQVIDKTIELLCRFAFDNKFSVKISLPPIFYSNDFISKIISSLYRSDFKLSYCDINHAFNTNKFNEYVKSLPYNGRKNLNNSKKHNLTLRKADSIGEIELAYEVIKLNREHRNYPLRMSFDAIKDTIEVIKADFFNLFYNNECIASAQVFHVANDIVQIIYWGDKPGYGHIRPMNYLAFKLFEYYKNLGVKFIDIGPSSEEGVPNYGLADFKESIGCTVSNKYTFSYEG